MRITDRIRRVLQDNGAWPPSIPIDQYEKDLWLLHPHGNPEDGYIQACLFVGKILMNSKVVTLDMMVRKRTAYISLLKAKNEDKWIRSLNSWLLKGGLDEEHVEPNERARGRFGYGKKKQV